MGKYHYNVSSENEIVHKIRFLGGILLYFRTHFIFQIFVCLLNYYWENTFMRIKTVSGVSRIGMF